MTGPGRCPRLAVRVGVGLAVLVSLAGSSAAESVRSVGSSSLGWAFVAPMPTARQGLVAVTGKDGRIYAIGGQDASLHALTTTEVYSPKKNEWATLAPMPTPRMYAAGVAGPDGRIYVIGGQTTLSGPALATVEVYAPATNTWAEAASLPDARTTLAAAVGGDGRIYAIGGDLCDPQCPTNGSSQDEVDAYSPASNTWTTVASMPTPRHGLAAANGSDGRIYAIGGFAPCCEWTNVVETYSPNTDTWVSVAPLDVPRMFMGATVGADGRIYAIGGWQCCGTPGFMSEVQAYDVGQGTWSQGPSLLEPVRSMGAATSGARIYAIGGQNADDPSAVINRVEALDLKPPGNSYAVQNLVSDGALPAASVDPYLVNGWGIAAGPSTPWWVSDNGSSVSTLYSGDGSVNSLRVSVAGGPTGVVYNDSSGFVVSKGGVSGPASFLFASEDGKIRGWNSNVSANQAVVAVSRTGSDAIYKGLALASFNGSDYLYATDFHNARVDVFDSDFRRVNLSGTFTDPSLPSGYAPFGIQALGGQIFVTYAKQNAQATDESTGAGKGYVDVFDPAGTLLARVASGQPLNAPWGLAEAPAGFGPFGGDLLVGNFGNGHIHAYSQQPDGTWALAGQLRNQAGSALTIDGLWGIGFGNGGPSGASNSLYFAAGPFGETHGLFGVVSPG